MRRFLIAAMLLTALALAACSSDAGSEEVDAELSSLKEDTTSLGEDIGDLEAQVAPLSQRIDVLETRLLNARRSEEDLAQRLEQQRLALADYEARTNGVINRMRDDIEETGENIANLEELLRQFVEDRSRLYYETLVNDLCNVLPDDIRASVCRRDSDGVWWRLQE